MNFCQPGAGRGVASGREIPYGRDISTIERQTTERDYEADDVLVVDKRDQLRALAHDLRATLVALLRERARSTQELAEQLALPKGTVGHHLKVLERAGLIRVVRTRQVRAVTEKYYGRVAWLFVIRCADAPEATGPLSAAAPRRAAAREARARRPRGRYRGRAQLRLRERLLPEAGRCVAHAGRRCGVMRTSSSCGPASRSASSDPRSRRWRFLGSQSSVSMPVRSSSRC